MPGRSNRQCPAWAIDRKRPKPKEWLSGKGMHSRSSSRVPKKALIFEAAQARLECESSTPLLRPVVPLV